MSDLCLDEFTDHGHCGVLDEHGAVDNDATLQRYAAMGAGPGRSGRPPARHERDDGRPGRRRPPGARRAPATSTPASSPTRPKYASGFYGPFREAVNSSLQGDRASYQQDASRTVADALAEVALDVAEGADIVMVKPALPYLDVLRAVADASPVPVAAYQISGEYAMVEAAAANGWLDRERVILETLTSIKRAGASIVLTYWAAEVATLLA